MCQAASASRSWSLAQNAAGTVGGCSESCVRLRHAAQSVSGLSRTRRVPQRQYLTGGSLVIVVSPPICRYRVYRAVIASLASARSCIRGMHAAYAAVGIDLATGLHQSKAV